MRNRSTRFAWATKISPTATTYLEHPIPFPSEEAAVAETEEGAFTHGEVQAHTCADPEDCPPLKQGLTEVTPHDQLRPDAPENTHSGDLRSDL